MTVAHLVALWALSSLFLIGFVYYEHEKIMLSDVLVCVTLAWIVAPLLLSGIVVLGLIVIARLTLFQKRRAKDNE